MAPSALEPLFQVFHNLKDLIPSKGWFKRPRLNFLSLHYIYILSASIVGSIIVYGNGQIPYIDAIFLATGSATQSGLNTLDLNTLELYTQITFMLIACITNPIFINTSVVFVRLYWFEKRFKDIVKEVRTQRTTWRISRSKSEARNDDPRVEQGVGGRSITVLHDTTRPNGMSGHASHTKEEAAQFAEKMGLSEYGRPVDSAESSSGSSHGRQPVESEHDALIGDSHQPTETEHAALIEDSHDSAEEPQPLAHRTITFPDELPKPGNPDLAQHIAIVQRQQQSARAEGGTLRIPGPRDFDRGEVPSEIAPDDNRLQLKDTNEDSLGGRNTRDSEDGHRDLGESEKHNYTSNSAIDDNDEKNTKIEHKDTHDDDLGHQHTSEEDKEKVTRMLSDNSKTDGPRHGISFNEPKDKPKHRSTMSEDGDAHSTKSGRLGHLRSRKTTSDLEDGDASPSKHSRFNPLRPRKTASDLDGDVNASRNNRLHPVRSRKTFARSLTNLSNALTQTKSQQESMPYLAFEATIGRNSAFVNLNKEQREELGGIEYRSLKLLRRILLGYFIGFHLVGLLVFLPWILYTPRWADIVIADGVDPGWWGVFTAASMFNDLGLTLTPDSMNSFSTAVVILLIGSFLIIIGNTGFPVMLRFIIWVLSKFPSTGSPLSDELHFLLDHPRRCFTLLFPSRANWWLFWILVLLNVIDLVFFIILDLDDDTVTQFAPGLRWLNGWFQATSTRTAGFSSVNIANLHPAIQVSYMIMMYISVLPIAISVRRTNVYEEKSLGLWGGEEQADMENPSYVGQHLRRQLSFDLWYIFLGFFIIAIVEGPRLQAEDDPAFSMFAVLFEIVSAYGTVGLSLGYPTINASFSAELHTISKLVIVAMMIRGRHRGLPYALDRAILLPSEKQYEKEAEDADRRYERRGSVRPEFDEMGLPRQHTIDRRHTAEQRSPLERRASTASTMSQNRRRQRGKSLGTLLSMGLTAGPTWHKDD